MLIVNLTKDPSIITLLDKIIKEASFLSTNDKKLDYSINELTDIIKNSTQVDFDKVVKSINNLASIVKSYNKQSDLSKLFYSLLNNLDELKSKTLVYNKYYAKANLINKIKHFTKLAAK